MSCSSLSNDTTGSACWLSRRGPTMTEKARISHFWLFYFTHAPHAVGVHAAQDANHRIACSPQLPHKTSNTSTQSTCASHCATERVAFVSERGALNGRKSGAQKPDWNELAPTHHTPLQGRYFRAFGIHLVFGVEQKQDEVEPREQRAADRCVHGHVLGHIICSLFHIDLSHARQNR